MSYSVTETFLTLQGEGQWSGTPAVFVRFAGCNVWSGEEEDRKKHASRGFCAAWCDTEFRGGLRYSAGQLVRRILTVADGVSLVVLTGGEPTLQVDAELVDALHMAGFRVHMETNGSRPAPFGVDWITLSPKPPMPVVAVSTEDPADEVKVVLAPGVNPADFRHLCPPSRLFVQPLDLLGVDPRAAVGYVLAHPWARLSLQTHKTLGLP